MKNNTPLQSRRNWLTSCLFSGGFLGLRAIASGLPVAAIVDPKRWLNSLSDETIEQQSRAAAVASPQFLVLAGSDQGEPLNCNVPGMYEGQGFYHPTADTMAEVPISLGTKTTQAAKVWTDLGAPTLARTCFFHHSTYSNAHGELNSVHRLRGAIDSNEMMVSAFAKALAVPLKTIQPQPINIAANGGTELINYDGIQQPMFSPSAIRNMLTTDKNISAFAKSQAMRDRDLDALYMLSKRTASKAQAQLIDSMVTSQAQARSLPASLLAGLSAITDDSLNSQMVVAALMCQMRLAPAVVVHMQFGGDNHVDTDSHRGPGALPGEAAEHEQAVKAINVLSGALATAGLSDSVTFTTLSTFGRSNTGPDRMGRAHNGLHTCNLLVGANIKGSVVGGADLTPGNNPKAQAIDPSSGAGGTGGSIAYDATFAAYGATLGSALGIADADLKTLIESGVKVTAALR